MYCGTLLILCSSITLVKNLPVQVFDYFDPATGQHELIEILDDDDEAYSSLEHKQIKKSILEPCLQSQNGDVKRFLADDGRNSRFEENLRVSMLPYYYGRDFGTYSPPQEDYAQEPYFEQYPYNSVAVEEMPFMNPASLYPSHGTYIHGLEDSPEPPTMESNVYESHNMPLNLRMARRTSYEEFLKQLQHDSMMNNILPTMSFVRSSGYEVPYGPARSLAYFPRAGSVNCAQPILVGCSPTVVQGHLAHWPQPQLPDHAYAPTIQLPHKTGLVIKNHKQGHDTIVPVLPNQDYRKVHVDLVSSKKI